MSIALRKMLGSVQCTFKSQHICYSSKVNDIFFLSISKYP